uniref:Uncharacterized protein n=1 Tax=Arundo donax TaxID=35708 RepID=A0A0A9DB56_ARUDO
MRRERSDLQGWERLQSPSQRSNFSSLKLPANLKSLPCLTYLLMKRERNYLQG